MPAFLFFLFRLLNLVEVSVSKGISLFKEIFYCGFTNYDSDVMIKNFLYVCIVGLVSFSPLFAQNKSISVKGKVLEDETKEAVVQATVQLLTPNDSVMISGAATGIDGDFVIKGVKDGKYILKISSVGYISRYTNLLVGKNSRDIQLGELILKEDKVLLKEVVVSGEQPLVAVKGDTVEYNSSAYRLPEGSVLEDLVKRLPGVEIDEEGKVKLNGKEIKKIMVEGKEFFGGDVKKGLQNLPTNIIDKVKAYDRKSDMATITGIDDDEEEPVLDLKVKKGMNKGTFGNVSVGVGTEGRYAGQLSFNRFVEKTELSVVAGANNINERNSRSFFSRGGGFRGFSNRGVNENKSFGVNLNTDLGKWKIYGNINYDDRNNDVVSRNFNERFLKEGSSYSASNSNDLSANRSFSSNFRFEWKLDSLTTIHIAPNLSYNKSNSNSKSENGTFNKYPYEFVDDVNDYLNLKSLDQMGNNDPLKDIRINGSNRISENHSKNINADMRMFINRRLSSNGRNISLTLRGGYSDNDGYQLSENETHYYKLKSKIEGQTDKDSILVRNQYITTPRSNYNMSARLMYSEPIGKGNFLQFIYQYGYRNTKSERSTYDMSRIGWRIDKPIPDNYQDFYVDSLGRNTQYHYYNQELGLRLDIKRQNYNITLGFMAYPQRSRLDYKRGAFYTDTVRTLVNFAPNLNFMYKFSKMSTLRFVYRGRTSEPNIEYMLPISDNSNPLNITVGNPGLKPSFTHSIMMTFFSNSPKSGRSIMMFGGVDISQNRVGTITEYNPINGGLITRRENINGQWSAFNSINFNTPLKDRRFNIGVNMNNNYSNNVSYLYNRELKTNDKNVTKHLSLNPRVNASFRNDWFEIAVNGSYGLTMQRNKLRPEYNQSPYTLGYGVSTEITFPWNMTLTTSLNSYSRKGYQDDNANRTEVDLNAKLTQSFFKGNAGTLSLEFYDILRQKSNFDYSVSAERRSTSYNNGINSYVMLRFTYKLNVFGGKTTVGRSSGRGGRGFGGHRVIGGTAIMAY